ncbi:MAG: DUF5663 domain-containing protein [Minisyncoccia bacterium]
MQDEMQKLIVQDLGIDALAPEEQQQIIAAFGEVALKAATLAIAESLPEEKRTAFASLAEGGDIVALSKFLSEAVPEHESIAKQAVAKELADFKAANASAAGAAQGV